MIFLFFVNIFFSSLYYSKNIALYSYYTQCVLIDYLCYQ